MQRLALAECEEIQAGADEYADRVLKEMELQLAEMLRVIRNGRQQLQPPQTEAPSLVHENQVLPIIFLPVCPLPKGSGLRIEVVGDRE